MMNTLARTLVAITMLSATAAQAQQTPPDALVRSTVDEVLAVIKQNKDPKALVDLAEKKVVSNFDFKEMTRLATGRAWSQASAAQQQALERGFRTLLVRTYTTALSQTSTDTKVEVKPLALKAGESETLVRTVVTEPGRKPFAIDYRMWITPSGWRVYDVTVENLSLVTNYRSSFQSEIGRSGIDGLIKTIEDKNRKLAAG